MLSGRVLHKPALAVAVAVALYFAPTSLQAQEDPEIGAATALLRTFQTLLSEAFNLGDTGERQFLLSNLVDLNRELYEIQFDKYFLIESLKRREPIDSEVQSSITHLRASVERAANHLRDIGDRLPSGSPANGKSAEQLLREALSSRKAWLIQLEQAEGRLHNDGFRTQIVERGQRAVEALATARTELNKVIDRLRGGA